MATPSPFDEALERAGWRPRPAALPGGAAPRPGWQHANVHGTLVVAALDAPVILLKAEGRPWLRASWSTSGPYPAPGSGVIAEVVVAFQERLGSEEGDRAFCRALAERGAFLEPFVAGAFEPSVSWFLLDEDGQPRPWNGVVTSAGEVLWHDLIARLRARPPATASDPAGCAACGAPGPTFDASAAPALSAAPVIAAPARWRLRECRSCGSLFRETADGASGRRATRAQAVSWLAVSYLTPEQARALVEEGAACMTALHPRLVETRGEPWRRCIYREGDVLLDVWYTRDSVRVGEFDVYPLGDLPAFLGAQSIPPHRLEPFAAIPAPVLQQGRERLRRLQAALDALTDDAHALPLDEQRRSLLLRRQALGWVWLELDGGRPSTVKLIGEAEVYARLAAAKEGQAPAPLELPASVRERLAALEAAAFVALARIDAAEIVRDGPALVAAVAGSYVSVRGEGELLAHLMELSRRDVLGLLLAGLVQDRPPAFVSPSGTEVRALRTDAPALMDAGRRWELFAAGRLQVGGGVTSDQQWTLRRDDRRQWCESTTSGEAFTSDPRQLLFAFTGSREGMVDEETARHILTEGGFAWMGLRLP